MTRILPLVATLWTLGTLAAPVHAQESDGEDEAQMEEEASEESSDDATSSGEEAEEEEEQSDGSDAESGDASEPAEAQTEAPPEPPAPPRGVADGAWSGQIQTYMGQKALQLTIENSRAATVTGDFGEASVDLRVDGNAVSWSWSQSVPMPMRIQCSGTVAGNTLSGDCDMQKFGMARVDMTRN